MSLSRSMRCFRSLHLIYVRTVTFLSHTYTSTRQFHLLSIFLRYLWQGHFHYGDNLYTFFVRVEKPIKYEFSLYAEIVYYDRNFRT